MSSNAGHILNISLCKRGHVRTPENVYASGHCKTCAVRWQGAYSKRPEVAARIKSYHKDYQIRKKFLLSRQDWNEILEFQEGRCAICLDRPETFCVDHDHKTGTVRGLLCNNCNAVLGFGRDSEFILKQAIKYLCTERN